MGAAQAGDQIEPKAGGWQTWVISAGREFRLPPPPSDAAEIAEVQSLASKRDAAARDLIAYWDRAAILSLAGDPA